MARERFYPGDLVYVRYRRTSLDIGFYPTVISHKALLPEKREFITLGTVVFVPVMSNLLEKHRVIVNDKEIKTSIIEIWA